MTKALIITLTGMITTLLCTQAFYAQATDLKKYPLLSADKGRGAVYVFLDDNACFTCNVSLQQLSKLMDKYAISSTIFLIGQGKESGSKFITRELPAFKNVVYDELSGYPSLYDVESVPELLVLGKDGTAFYRGVPGKVSFSLTEFTLAIEKVLSQRVEKFEYSLPHVEKLPTTLEALIPPEFHGSSALGTSMRFSERDSSYYLLIHSTKNIFVIDNRGRVSGPYGVQPKNASYMSSTPILAGLGSKSMEVAIWDTDFESAVPHLSLINLIDSTYREIALPAEWKRISTRCDFNEPNSPSIITRRITDGASSCFIRDSGMVFVGKSGDWKKIGNYAEQYYDTLLCQSGWVSCCSGGDYIYCHQNFTDYISVFNNGEIVGRIPLNIGNEVYKDLNYSHDVLFEYAKDHDISKMLSLKLRTHKIFYDVKSNKLCLALMFARKQLGDGNSGSMSNRDFQMLMVFIDLDARKQYRFAQAPMNFIPHGISDGIIYGIYQIDKEMRIGKISVPHQ